MLARKSVLNHRLGFKLETPLLIPSFSSKGFLFQKKGKKQISEAKYFMDLTKDVLTDTLLVSAYDVYKNYIYNARQISKIANITFIDSGGYEVSDYHDHSAVFRHPAPEGADWNEDKLKTVLDKWPKREPAVIISFDNRAMPLPKQMGLARKLFAQYSDQMSDFIIKPDNKKSGKYIDMDSVIPHVKEFVHFDIIGVTEKELGNSMLNRMLNIAKLRKALDNVNIKNPIHVFGSLDPISSCLYFFAGAEIFDGLTWLRYSYYEGKAVYYQNHGMLEYGVFQDDDFMKARTFRENIYYMIRLQSQMQEFLVKSDFRKFEFYGKELKAAYETFESRGGIN